MSNLVSFDVSWTVADRGYRFVSERSLLVLADGDEVVLPMAAWVSLREVLALLPDEWLWSAEPTPLPRPLKGPANRGRAWTPDEEGRCAEAYRAGDGPEEIAMALGRTRGAVMARLVRLGLVEEEEAGLRYPPGRVGQPASAPPAE